MNEQQYCQCTATSSNSVGICKSCGKQKSVWISDETMSIRDLTPEIEWYKTQNSDLTTRLQLAEKNYEVAAQELENAVGIIKDLRDDADPYRHLFLIDEHNAKMAALDKQLAEAREEIQKEKAANDNLVTQVNGIAASLKEAERRANDMEHWEMLCKSYDRVLNRMGAALQDCVDYYNTAEGFMKKTELCEKAKKSATQAIAKYKQLTEKR